MSINNSIIHGLQAIVTQLSQQADGHAIQSKIFENQGFSKLSEKYAEHTTEERDYVDQFVDRILDLHGTVANQAKQETPLYEDAIEWIKYDTQASREGLAGLSTIIHEAAEDLTTYDMLKEYYKDEEEDMYWGEQQLELIEKIGEENWLCQQL